MFSRIYESDSNQYTVGAVSACTLMATEVALRLVREGVEPSVSLINDVLLMGASYTNNRHLDVEELVKNVARYSGSLRIAQVNALMLNDVETIPELLMAENASTGLNVAAVITKPPETVMLALLNPRPRDAPAPAAPAPSAGEGGAASGGAAAPEAAAAAAVPVAAAPPSPAPAGPRWVLFDSHRRVDHQGAALLEFESSGAVAAYLSVLFPAVALTEADGLDMAMLNMLDISVLAPVGSGAPAVLNFDALSLQQQMEEVDRAVDERKRQDRATQRAIEIMVEHEEEERLTREFLRSQGLLSGGFGDFGGGGGGGGGGASAGGLGSYWQPVDVWPTGGGWPTAAGGGGGGGAGGRAPGAPAGGAGVARPSPAAGATTTVPASLSREEEERLTMEFLRREGLQ